MPINSLFVRKKKKDNTIVFSLVNFLHNLEQRKNYYCDKQKMRINSILNLIKVKCSETSKKNIILKFTQVKDNLGKFYEQKEILIIKN